VSFACFISECVAREGLRVLVPDLLAMIGSPVISSDYPRQSIVRHIVIRWSTRKEIS
jgi:hypothetical protein